ncbi:hypothetical protein [Helicobacter suis]|uniref:hypothetical protein n=1 Tax=Helicobacter suis TaxID=104628 RepID=UPI0013D72F0A|nr:hypothetical protein [Helicobacter suis]
MPWLILFLALVTLQAEPMDTLKQWVRAFLEKPKVAGATYTIYPKNNHDKAYQQSISVNNTTYTFLYAYGVQKIKQNEKKAMCLGVLLGSTLYKGFCLKGFGQAHIQVNQGDLHLDFLKSSPATPTAPAKESGIYFTFTNIKGTFYLMRYAKKEVGSEQIIPYYNPPKNSTTYSMETINNTLLEQLSKKESTQQPLPAPTTPVTQKAPVTQKQATQKVQEMQVDGQTYHLVYTSDATMQCLKILQYQRVLGNFCMQGAGSAQFNPHAPWLTLEFKKEGSNSHHTSLTFKIIDGTFYLENYIKRFFQLDPTTHAEIFLRLEPIYKQSRDDPNYTHPITLLSLNPNFQQELQIRCQEKGYCQQ